MQSLLLRYRKYRPPKSEIERIKKIDISGLVQDNTNISHHQQVYDFREEGAGGGRALMDAIDRDPVTAKLDCQRLCHVHQAGHYRRRGCVSFLRRPGLAQAGKISGFEQGPGRRRGEILGTAGPLRGDARRRPVPA